MNTSIVVAMDRNCAIGKEGGMPWKLKKELNHFAKLTT